MNKKGTTFLPNSQHFMGLNKNALLKEMEMLGRHAQFSDNI